jgi:hypothetical protein
MHHQQLQAAIKGHTDFWRSLPARSHSIRRLWLVRALPRSTCRMMMQCERLAAVRSRRGIWSTYHQLYSAFCAVRVQYNASTLLKCHAYAAEATTCLHS